MTNLFQTYYCLFLLVFKWFYFPNLLLLGKPPDFDENCHFFIYAQTMYWNSGSKITLSHAHKSMISDVIQHKLIFSVVSSSPGGSCMSHQVETIQERNAA